MAEFGATIAASMVEGVVTALVQKLSSSIAEDLGVLLGVRREIRYIKEEFDIMKAFLIWAEERQETDAVASAWVKQVRELAYDVEDCINEFAIHLEWPIQHCLLGVYRHRVHSQQIYTEIQDIKSRVQNLSERRLRYGLTGTAQGSSSTTSAASVQAKHDPRESALYIVDEAQLVGLDSPRDEVIGWLLEESEPRLSTVSVVGMGGLGKTTLAKMVFDSPRVTGGFFHWRAWITVSQQFEKKRFLSSMFKKVFPDGSDKQDEDQLIEKIRGELQDKRYVIVFDDIWTTNAWESIKLVLPDVNNGSRIMVTTRDERVAYSCCSPYNHKYVFKLPILSLEQSMDLFCRRLFGYPGNSCPPNFNDLAEGILRKCGGLPLAIVTIASLLASNPNNSREEWQNLYDRLGLELDSNPSLDGIKRILNLSYDDLPHHLKRCFLYLSIFPENYLVKRKHLQRLWIAEGFVKGHTGMTSTEVAGSYFNELINRSLILPSEISACEKVKSCRVHDIMLEVIASKSMKENFTCVFGEHNFPMPQDAIRRLSIHANFCSAENNSEENTMSLSRVRSLTMFGDGRPSLVTPSLRLLAVLDLEACTRLEDHHLKKIGKFHHLKYLSLRSTKISVLPESIGNLRNLETLDVRDCNFITEMPKGLIKLKKLCFLLGGGTYCSPKLPQGIRRLQALQKLVVVNVERGHQGVVKDVGRLTKLRKLGVTGVTEKNAVNFCASLGKITSCLRSLEVHFQVSAMYSEVLLTSLDSITSPPILLQRLKLHGHLGRLPSWACMLKNVAKILLHGTGLGDDAIQVLQTLPNLTHLELELDSYIGKNLHFSGRGFTSLKKLHLVWLKELLSLKFENKAMPNLEVVFIDYCYLLREEGSLGIEHLASLKEIVLRYMPTNVVDMLQKAVEAHPKHPRFINHSS